MDLQREQEWLEKLRIKLPQTEYREAVRTFNDIWNLHEEGQISNSFIAELARCDRYFLLVYILNATYAAHEWIYNRCREVESEPDDHLDLWARGHFKTTVISFAGTIQEIIKDPEITIGIFSNANKDARKFLRQLKIEFEENEKLHKYWPDIFWEYPKKEAPKWSEDDGLIVRRRGNPREATLSSFGLVDAQPTGSHFALRVYDDVVTEDSVGTPDMIAKTTDRWELSQNLSITEVDGAIKKPRQWHIGTRYNFADTYGVILKRKALQARVYPATEDGTLDGKPVLLSQEAWDKKRRNESPYTIACQQLLNPLAGDEQEFKLEWMRPYEIRPETLNIYILGDPASSKKKGTSNTAMAVIGVDAARNKYLLDGACHKMNLSERWVMLKGLRRKWLKQKGIQSIQIGYERYGHQTDIEHFQEMMKIEKYSFPIEEVSWTRDHIDAKDDRIRRLIPDHMNWRFFYPYEGEKTTKQLEMEDRGKGFLLARPIKRVNEKGRIYNLVEYLINNEYLFFPATTAKDLLDAMSRLYDMDINPPAVHKEEDTIPPHAGED